MTLDILCETDEAVARCREDTQLEDGDENESEPEDSEDSGDPREPEQLTCRVPCIKSYSPSFVNLQCRRLKSRTRNYKNNESYYGLQSVCTISLRV